MPTIDPTKRIWRMQPDWETRELTETERAFLDAFASLEEKSPKKLGLPDVWLENDEDGTPWMMLYVCPGEHTWRLDVDARGIRGGKSPCQLNGDAGERAEEAGIDMQKPEGICVDSQDAVELATLARGWLIGRTRK